MLAHVYMLPLTVPRLDVIICMTMRQARRLASRFLLAALLLACLAALLWPQEGRGQSMSSTGTMWLLVGCDEQGCEWAYVVVVAPVTCVDAVSGLHSLCWIDEPLGPTTTWSVTTLGRPYQATVTPLSWPTRDSPQVVADHSADVCGGYRVDCGAWGSVVITAGIDLAVEGAEPVTYPAVPMGLYAPGLHIWTAIDPLQGFVHCPQRAVQGEAVTCTVTATWTDGHVSLSLPDAVISGTRHVTWRWDVGGDGWDAEGGTSYTFVPPAPGLYMVSACPSLTVTDIARPSPDGAQGPDLVTAADCAGWLPPAPVQVVAPPADLITPAPLLAVPGERQTSPATLYYPVCGPPGCDFLAIDVAIEASCMPSISPLPAPCTVAQPGEWTIATTTLAGYPATITISPAGISRAATRYPPGDTVQAGDDGVWLVAPAAPASSTCLSDVNCSGAASLVLQAWWRVRYQVDWADGAVYGTDYVSSSHMVAPSWTPLAAVLPTRPFPSLTCQPVAWPAEAVVTVGQEVTCSVLGGYPDGLATFQYRGGDYQAETSAIYAWDYDSNLPGSNWDAFGGRSHSWSYAQPGRYYAIACQQVTVDLLRLSPYPAAATVASSSPCAGHVASLAIFRVEEGGGAGSGAGLPDPLAECPPVGIGLNPALGLTGLPTWAWATGAGRDGESVPRGSGVVDTYTPYRWVWDWGDGTPPLVVGWPGNAYPDPGNVTHTYERTSFSQPDMAYQVTLTVTFAVWRWDGQSWTYMGDCTSTATRPHPVQQVQSVLGG